MRRITDTVKHLLIINIIFFFASSVLGEIMYDLFAMHYPNNSNFLFGNQLPICSCMEV